MQAAERSGAVCAREDHRLPFRAHRAPLRSALCTPYAAFLRDLGREMALHAQQRR